MADLDVARLESIAQQLVARVHEDAPEANARWLHANTTADDREALLYVLAVAVPTDRTWRQLTAWTRRSSVDTPVDNAKRQRMRRVA